MKQILHDISQELHEYIRDTGFIVVEFDSMSLPVLTRKSKHKIKELKNVEEHIFYPGGDSNHYRSMMTNAAVICNIPTVTDIRQVKEPPGCLCCQAERVNEGLPV